jgi:uncharacterized protein (DUF1330 family)
MEMKTYKLIGIVFGSFVLGASAASVLHAQSKLPAIVVAEIDVKDQDGYKNDFLPKAQANIKEHGGVYLAGGYNKTATGSGAPPPNRVVLIQYPDMEAAKAFFMNEKPLEEAAAKYATFRTYAVEAIEKK